MGAFTQFIMSYSGDQDLTGVVVPDKRKLLATQSTMTFQRQPADVQVGTWTVNDDETVDVTALTDVTVFSLNDNITFRDRVNEWIRFLDEEFDQLGLIFTTRTGSNLVIEGVEHEIKVTDTEIEYKFEIDAGIVTEGTFEFGIFNQSRPTDITMSWGEFLLWQLFLDEILLVARNL